ncbi:hypothetical protein CJ179_41625 [Rhodococcus sp. ACS1]|nr:hypothetical protein CJ179_41625 [Rhodococcus sp. ACS1]
MGCGRGGGRFLAHDPWFLSVSSIPVRRRGGDPWERPLRYRRRRPQSDAPAIERSLRPNPVCLVCMGVDVDDGFSDSTYQ